MLRSGKARRPSGAGAPSIPSPAAGNDPQPQLYDLSADVAERNNLAAQHPEKVQAMRAELERIRQGGRTAQ